MKKPGCASFFLIGLMLLVAIVIFPAMTFYRTGFFTALCSRLIPKTGIDLDRDHCIKRVAVYFEDPEMCEEIRGDKFFTEYEGQKIQLENPPKMQCLTDIAAEKNDPALCDGVIGVLVANTKIDCLYQVAARNNNPAACDAIGDEEQSRVGMVMNKADCIAQLRK